MAALIGIILLGSVIGWGVSKGLDAVTAPPAPTHVEAPAQSQAQR